MNTLLTCAQLPHRANMRSRPDDFGNMGFSGRRAGRQSWRAHCEGGDMSQKTVQLLIGRLLTDEDLRLRFVQRPFETLVELRDQGLELTADEIEALIQIDSKVWPSMAARIHPRLQRCSLRSS
jgi:hypothetical protein